MRNQSLSRILPAAIAGALLSLSAVAADFTLESTNLQSGGKVPAENVFNGFGCTGANVSPELHWKNAPAGTQGYAVTVYDPDAPTGSGWWHWVVINIPASQTSLTKGFGNIKPGEAGTASPMQMRTDFGTAGWGGPCPPQGDKPHRYIFNVYAMKVPKLDLPADASAAMVGYMINFNKLDQASFTAYYGR